MTTATMLALLSLLLRVASARDSLAVDIDLDHGYVACDDHYCYLTCDSGWINNGTYKIRADQNDFSELSCVEPATLVIAGYGAKPDPSSSGRFDDKFKTS